LLCQKTGIGDRRVTLFKSRTAKKNSSQMMTVVAIMAGLLPILWGSGTRAEVMSRIAAPMVGDMNSIAVLTLAVIPAIYALVKQWRLKRGQE
jgi:Cu(I)/Ag(I) efflux system membrane protein CusA/SilA